MKDLPNVLTYAPPQAEELDVRDEPLDMRSSGCLSSLNKRKNDSHSYNPHSEKKCQLSSPLPTYNIVLFKMTCCG